MKLFFKTIEEVPAAIVEAYKAGKYRFDPACLPIQAHTHWTTVNWINYVLFAPALEALRRNVAGRWWVVVGNVGTVYDGASEEEASKMFAEYVSKSESGQGRAGNEQVSLFHGEDLVKSHEPEEVR